MSSSTSARRPRCLRFPAQRRESRVDPDDRADPRHLFRPDRQLARLGAEPDTAVSAPRNSGSQELMHRLVMRERAMIKASDLLTGTLMSMTFLALDKDTHGIGYSVYYYHEFMSPNKQVKLRGRRRSSHVRDYPIAPLSLCRRSLRRGAERPFARSPGPPPARLAPGADGTEHRGGERLRGNYRSTERPSR